MGDFNQDLMQRSSPTRRMMESMGLVDGIISKYGGVAPPTHAYGTSPIDGIFVSPTLWVVRGGYTATET